jgi:hypothetical protein
MALNFSPFSRLQNNFGEGAAIVRAQKTSAQLMRVPIIPAAFRSLTIV